MKLSIIIVSYNTSELTLACIKSIFKYKPEFDFEVIVVDNGSSDGTVSSIRHPELISGSLSLIQNKTNLGFSKANNQGIKKARGEYILLLNSDTEVTKDSIDNLVNFAENNNNAGAVVPRLLNEDGSIQKYFYKAPTLWRAIKQYWLHIDNEMDPYYPKVRSPVEVEAAVMAAFLITPKALQKIGLLDERYFFYYEDLEYCRQLRKNGLKIYYLPDVKITHLVGASGKNLASWDNQWRRFIPSSKIYNGIVVHYVLFFVTKSSEIVSRMIKKIKK
jgi:hypothetical protein